MRSARRSGLACLCSSNWLTLQIIQPSPRQRKTGPRQPFHRPHCCSNRGIDRRGMANTQSSHVSLRIRSLRSAGTAFERRDDGSYPATISAASIAEHIDELIACNRVEAVSGCFALGMTLKSMVRRLSPAMPRAGRLRNLCSIIFTSRT